MKRINGVDFEAIRNVQGISVSGGNTLGTFPQGGTQPNAILARMTDISPGLSSFTGSATSDASTVVLTLTIQLSSGQTIQHDIAFPVGSSTLAGVVNATQVASLEQLAIDVANLKDQTGDFIDTFATKAALDAYTGAKDKGDYANIEADETHDGKSTRYIWNGTEWQYQYSFSTTIALATNTTAGIVKGSEEDGKFYAEADGTGSVNGWDTLKTNAGKADPITAFGMALAASVLTATITTEKGTKPATITLPLGQNKGFYTALPDANVADKKGDWVMVNANNSLTFYIKDEDGTETAWTEQGSISQGISDAPSDGKIYGRKNQAWQEIVGGDGGVNDVKNSSGESLVSDGVATLKKFTADETQPLETLRQGMQQLQGVQFTEAPVGPFTRLYFRLVGDTSSIDNQLRIGDGVADLLLDGISSFRNIFSGGTWYPSFDVTGTTFSVSWIRNENGIGGTVRITNPSTPINGYMEDPYNPRPYENVFVINSFGNEGNMTMPILFDIRAQLKAVQVLAQQALNQSSLTSWYDFAKQGLQAGAGLSIGFDDDNKIITYTNTSMGGGGGNPTLTVQINPINPMSGVPAGSSVQAILTRVEDGVKSSRRFLSDEYNTMSISFTPAAGKDYKLKFQYAGRHSQEFDVNISASETLGPLDLSWEEDKSIVYTYTGAGYQNAYIEGQWNMGASRIAVYLDDSLVGYVTYQNSSDTFNIPAGTHKIRLQDDSGMYAAGWARGVYPMYGIKSNITSIDQYTVEGFMMPGDNYTFSGVLADYPACTFIADFVFPDGYYTTLPDYFLNGLFRSNRSLTEPPKMVFPESVTSFGSYCFGNTWQDCYNLETPPEIDIQASTPYFSDNCFQSTWDNCVKLPADYTIAWLPNQLQGFPSAFDSTEWASTWRGTKYYNMDGKRPRFKDGTECTYGFFS
jgi:hypothetical protein